MNENNKHYRVIVGHISIDVSATNNKQALQQARRQMCNEMPRLWDVIATLDDSRFVVQELSSAAVTEAKP